MKKFIPSTFEAKWQERWSFDKLYQTDLNKSKDKYYVLAELTYPSGDLHMGHWYTFAPTDIIARFKRMQGFNVIFPNGFDAFGLPAENAAIKRGIHPQDWTLSNIERMKIQFASMGASFDWDKSAITCLPEYYKWNQWVFLKMYERGLAYRGKMTSNWCPSCQTVLANENVEAGKCWRCGSEVEQQEIEQWFLKITEYADRLIWQEPSQTDWPKSLRDAQNSWIGKSEGTLIKFDDLEVFTTRPDTLFGATFVAISPEHPLLKKFTTREQEAEVVSYANKALKKSELERKENKEKTGVFTGSQVTNPLTGGKIPVWVADYVLISYGTGAIMAVPAHDDRDFEFAKKFDLPINQVIETSDNQPLPYSGQGKLINSEDFSGMSSIEAKKKITDYLVKRGLGKPEIHYHLHDWSISRQRYWGTPIPMIHCEKCGVVPVPEKDLPVELPYEVDYAPKGKPPLATAEEWVNVKCPKCEGPGRREVETMDTFVDSSWYFFRYLDPHNQQQIFDSRIINNWMPLEIYIGGAEHTLGHALYSRFFTKFFQDLGLIDFDEYAKRRVHHGLILGTDGQKMSKSKGNVINPDEQIQQYGADAVRCYLSFLGPYDIVAPWNPAGVNGVYHFLERIWGLYNKVQEGVEISVKDQQQMHKTVEKVSRDLEVLKFNTAMAAMMEWLNHLSRKDRVSKEEYKTLLLLLAPYAPHMTEQLWEIMGEKYSIHQQSWPKFDKKYLEEEEALVVVQVNGKVRDNLMIQKDIVNNKEVVEKMARESLKVQKFIGMKKVVKTIYIPGKVLNLVVV
jgi:leucyl-tRNA synthetase